MENMSNRDYFSLKNIVQNEHVTEMLSGDVSILYVREDRNTHEIYAARGDD
jgi:hypothetical protein